MNTNEADLLPSEVEAPNEQATFDLLEEKFGNDWFISRETNEVVTIEFEDEDSAARFKEKVRPIIS